MVCLFCAFNFTEELKNFVNILTTLVLFNKIEIWTKFFISRAILKAQKRQTTFWKWQDKGNFVIIISRNLLLNLGWQINAANYIKNQDDIQVVLHTVMFRGTPCISRCLTNFLALTIFLWIKRTKRKFKGRDWIFRMKKVDNLQHVV